MSALSRAKSRRAAVRGKMTKLIRNAEKVLSVELSALITEELRLALQAMKDVLDEHQEANTAVLEAMADEGATEDQVLAETDNSSDVETKVEDCIRKIRCSVAQNQLYLDYQTVVSSSDSWMEHSHPTAANFSKDGRLMVQQLEKLMSRLEPYKTNPTFQPLHSKVRDSLGKIPATIFKTPTATAAATPASTTAKKLPPPYQVKTPTFSGKLKEFQPFSDRFQEIMETHKGHYTHADKCCILADAMLDRDAKKLVNDHAAEGYDAAFKQLKDRCGRSSVIFPQLVEELLSRNRYDYSQESMLLALDRTQRLLTAMEKIGGKDIEALAVALVIRDCDDEVRKEWAKHLGPTDKIPVLDDFVKFASPLSHNLPRKNKSLNGAAVSLSSQQLLVPKSRRRNRQQLQPLQLPSQPALFVRGQATPL